MYNHCDPRTPVLIGVGQANDQMGTPEYKAMSPADLCAQAAGRALDDAQVPAGALIAAIDVIVATRQFENSKPDARAPLGRADNLPRAVARRLGADPRDAILEVLGGQSPQHLVNEFAHRLADGEMSVVLLVGAESISTQRHFQDRPDRPDFSETVGGALVDRGYGYEGLYSRYQADHGMGRAPEIYAVLENARRARSGLGLDAYRKEMGKLFQPFTEVAASNPYSSTHVVRRADELATPTELNRPIADPYLRYVVSRDLVNQGAAVILTTVGRAREIGVPESKWVFLRGHADLQEKRVLERPDLGAYPAAGAAVREALRVAGISLDQVTAFDLYSCFPIAVSAVTDAISLAPDDARPFTLTGGLPFFGGAGNNYSMHAIAEAVQYARRQPGSHVLLGANGGYLSKYSVGIYSTAAPDKAWVDDRSHQLQAELDAVPSVAVVRRPQGWGRIESYTISHSRDGRSTYIVVGRLDPDDRRFLATIDADDQPIRALLEEGMPFGKSIYVQPGARGNRVSLSADHGAQQPGIACQLLDKYEYLEVRRADHVLEITINRPKARNALIPPAHDELDQVFSAFFTDPELWVAIITGAGDKAFCAGNDLVYTGQGKPMWLPLSGFGGITARRNVSKPVICAVNGYAMGGGFEIALACHLVVADTQARFALSEPRVGLIAGSGGLVRLPRQIPVKIANELILTGRQMPAEEARSLGIVNEIVPAGTALAGARALAQQIIQCSPTSIRLSLQTMNKVANFTDAVDGIAAMQDEMDDLFASQDAWEGMAAFAQKRPPNWRNH